MVFRKLALSTMALAICSQLIVASATLSVLIFHPNLMGDFEEASLKGIPLEVTCQPLKDVDDVMWDIQDPSFDNH